jgi:hypothetical protein
MSEEVPDLHDKYAIADLISEKGYKVAVDIGTGEGGFTDHLLSNTDIETMHCIDKWEDWDNSKPDGHLHFFKTNGTERMNNAKERLEKFGDRVQFIQKSSQKAINRFDDESIDVLFLDGDITTDNFFNDMRKWIHKVKVGGLIFGAGYSKKQKTKMVINVIGERYNQDIKYTRSSRRTAWYFVKEELPEEKEALDIEVAIHCYHYQHRLCWMLSSILSQVGDDLPNITISISYAPNNGNPTTEKVCEFFREQGLNIKETVVTEKQASNRAIARNLQIKDSTADWIIFADSDMVYDTGFFNELHGKLKTNLKYETLCMGADRVSLNIDFCIKYFEEDQTEYPRYVEDAAEIAKDFPVKWVTGRRVAPGYFQLANVDSIRTKGGVYSYRERDHWRGTRSDRYFRMIMGGRRPIIMESQQFHLNHDRGGPEIQR